MPTGIIFNGQLQVKCKSFPLSAATSVLLPDRYLGTSDRLGGRIRSHVPTRRFLSLLLLPPLFHRRLAHPRPCPRHPVPNPLVHLLIPARHRRRHVLEGVLEVFRGDLHPPPSVLFLLVLPLLGAASVRHGPGAEHGQARLAQKGGAVGAAVPLRPVAVRDRTEVHIVRQMDLGGQGGEDGEAVVGARKGHVEELVEAAGSQHGGIDELGPVGGGDDEDAPAAVQPVHFGQELVDHAFAGLVSCIRSAPGTERVELVEEDDARRGRSGPLEHLSYGPFALPHVLVQQLGSLDADEIGPRFVGDSLGQQRLPAPGRTVKHHPRRQRNS
mmetsp:Transcript_36846/g.86043  ORF Transcript_36846/g.86043 Transcript_36846/m.86043 type:complete len:327 (-) Transcript_36846:1139-2119(-)